MWVNLKTPIEFLDWICRLNFPIGFNTYVHFVAITKNFGLYVKIYAFSPLEILEYFLKRIDSLKKEEGPERGDLCRPTRREFRCLLCLGIWHRLLLGKAVANLGGDHICCLEIIRPY